MMHAQPKTPGLLRSFQKECGLDAEALAEEDALAEEAKKEAKLVASIFLKNIKINTQGP